MSTEWGLAARDWAEVQEPTLLPLFSTVLERLDVRAGRSVLDVGCGTGLLGELASRNGAIVAGLDASEAQLRFARARTPEASWVLGDLVRLPFPSSEFDVVTCCNALQYASDAAAALAEMQRVARSGGAVVVMTHSLVGPQDTGAIISRVRRFLPGDDDDRPALGIFRVRGTLESFLDRVSLAIEQDEEVGCPWNYADLATAVRGILSSAVCIRAIRQAGWAVVSEEVALALEPYRTPEGTYSVPRQMRYVVARAMSGNQS